MITVPGPFTLSVVCMTTDAMRASVMGKSANSARALPLPPSMP
jgi:hypothetical protein